MLDMRRMAAIAGISEVAEVMGREGLQGLLGGATDPQLRAVITDAFTNALAQQGFDIGPIVPPMEKVAALKKAEEFRWEMERREATKRRQAEQREARTGALQQEAADSFLGQRMERLARKRDGRAALHARWREQEEHVQQQVRVVMAARGPDRNPNPMFPDPKVGAVMRGPDRKPNPKFPNPKVRAVMAARDEAKSRTGATRREVEKRKAEVHASSGQRRQSLTGKFPKRRCALLPRSGWRSVRASRRASWPSCRASASRTRRCSRCG